MNDANATQLQIASVSILAVVDSVASALAAGVLFRDAEEGTNVHQLLRGHFFAFRQWKVPDEVRIVTRIQHAIVALMRADLQIPDDEPENPNRTEIRFQINRLREQLLRIVGQARVDAFDALLLANPLMAQPPVAAPAMVGSEDDGDDSDGSDGEDDEDGEDDSEGSDDEDGEDDSDGSDGENDSDGV